MMHHLHINVEELIRWPTEHLERLFVKNYINLITGETSKRSLPASEVVAVLISELKQGHAVIPIGQCDNFDYSGGGCRGHEEVDHA